MNATSKIRQSLLENYLCAQTANVVDVPVSKIDVQQPLSILGVDSLTAIELKNSIEVDLGITVPVVKLLCGPTIVHLATQMLDQLTEGCPRTPALLTRDPEQLLTKLDQLSDEEVDALLHEMSDPEEITEIDP